MSMDGLVEALTAIQPLVTAAIDDLKAETPELEAAMAEAETGPYSWDLSAQKGAEMRLDEHQARIDALEDLRGAVEEALAALEG